MTKTEFVEKLSESFISYIDKKPDENILSSAFQYWFFTLPKYTKITTILYLEDGQLAKLDERILKLKEYLRKPEINANSFLFEILPVLFDETDLLSLADKVIAVKSKIDDIFPLMVENLKNDICTVFNCSDKAILWQKLINWYGLLPERTKRHCFDGGEERLLKAIEKKDNSITNLCISLIGLAPEDFEENTPLLLIEKISAHKSVIESFDTLQQDNMINTYAILLEGYPIKTFKKIHSVSKEGNLLFNELSTIVSEYGQSIGINEKRQILLNVIDSLDSPSKEVFSGIH